MREGTSASSAYPFCSPFFQRSFRAVSLDSCLFGEGDRRGGDPWCKGGCCGGADLGEPRARSGLLRALFPGCKMGLSFLRFPRAVETICPLPCGFSPFLTVMKTSLVFVSFAEGITQPQDVPLFIGVSYDKESTERGGESRSLRGRSRSFGRFPLRFLRRVCGRSWWRLWCRSCSL